MLTVVVVWLLIHPCLLGFTPSNDTHPTTYSFPTLLFSTLQTNVGGEEILVAPLFP